MLRFHHLVSVLAGLVAGVAAQVGPYAVLDTPRDNWIHTHTVPVRPMAFAEGGGTLWACNPYLNEVATISVAGSQPATTFRTLRGPVAIARHRGVDGDLLLVVCQLSNALAVHSLTTGEFLRTVPVPAEPADLLVHRERNRIYVAGMATDEVAEIDAATWTEIRRYAIPSKAPTFLARTPAGDVLVAPRRSGNNSAVHRMPASAAYPQDHLSTRSNDLGILDLADPGIAVRGLPDEDLFWLDPTSGTARPVVTGAGTILLAHGVNPRTGRYWILNTDANNKNPARQTERSIRGEFATNRLTIVDLPDLATGAVAAPDPGDVIDLDDVDPTTPGTQHDANRPVGLPFGLAFTSTGHAFVTGLLSANVVILDPFGRRLLEFDLPSGASMPRHVLLDPSESFLAVWSADNQVVLYALTGPTPLLAKQISVGFDPTPEPIRAGRRLFFDGSHSQHGNLSCATCHDEGGTDLLAWNLSSATDDKGPMVTQTMIGLARTPPFHWRGERPALVDFNDAFPALLGGQPMATGPDSDFEHFEAFVLSLTHPANPRQNRDRSLDGSIPTPNLLLGRRGDPVRGQRLFRTDCTKCHALPTGTNNQLVGDGGVFREPRPTRQWFRTAPFHALPYSAMPTAQVLWNPAHPVLGPIGAQVYPQTGSALGHSGNPRNLAHFVEFFFPAGTPEHADVTAFVHQFDQGTAPATHGHFLWTQDTTQVQIGTDLGRHLLQQAIDRNCDVAVFGRTTIGGVRRTWGWYFWPATGLFVRDDLAWNSAGFFATQIQNSPDDWFCFLGVPPGTGMPAGIDFDGDLLPNGLERDPLAQRDVDTDRDGYWDGHEHWNGGNPQNAKIGPTDTTPPVLVDAELQWVTATVARLNFEISELVRADVTYTPQVALPVAPVMSVAPPDGGFAPTATTARPVTRGLSEFRWMHSIVLSDLQPGTVYSGRITMTDLGGLTRTAQLPSMQTRPTSGPAEVVIADDLRLISADLTDGVGNFSVRVRVVHKTTRLPAANHVVAARVFRNGTVDRPRSPISWFRVNGTPYAATPGPFVVGEQLTDQNGWVMLEFQLEQLQRQDRTELVLAAIGPAVDPGTFGATSPDMKGAHAPPDPPFPDRWSLPDTDPNHRKLVLTRGGQRSGIEAVLAPGTTTPLMRQK